MISIGKFENLNVYVSHTQGFIFKKNKTNYRYAYSPDLFDQFEFIKKHKNSKYEIALNNAFGHSTNQVASWMDNWTIRSYYDFNDNRKYPVLRYDLNKFYLYLINNEYISNCLTIKDILE